MIPWKVIFLLACWLSLSLCGKHAHKYKKLVRQVPHRYGNATLYRRDGGKRKLTRQEAIRNRPPVQKQQVLQVIDDFSLQNLVTAPLEAMHRSGFKGKPVSTKSQTSMTTTKRGFKDKVNQKFDTWDNSKKHKAAQAITGCIGGIPGIVQGYKDGDWRAMFTGALTVAAGVANLFGPIGSIVSTVLSFISSIFSLFGGSSEPPKESQEDMMKRVVETALEKSQIEALKDEIAGVQNLYTTLGDSVSHLRELNEADDESISVEQGVQLYNHAFQELVSFGKLQEAINQYCEADYLHKVPSEQPGKKKAQDHNQEVKENVKRCAIFVRLYCALAIQRQFLLTDMAAVINDGDDPKLRQTALNFVYLLKREQERDKKLLRFLSDPINYPNRRYAAACFFTSPAENKLASAYIATLNKDPYPGFYLPGIVACTDVMLHGRCIALEEIEGVVPGESYKSVFVPQGLTFSWGPDIYAGATTAHSNPRYPFELDGTDAFTLEESEEGMDALSYVRICNAETENENNIPTRRCKTYKCKSEFQYYSATSDISITPVSAYIPDKCKVTLYKASDEADNPTDVVYYGPDNLAVICDEETWTRIQVKKMQESNKLVKACNQQSFQGNCYSVPVPAMKHNVVIPWGDFTGIHCATDLSDLFKSVQVPQGVEVSLLADPFSFAGSLGPFVGPASLSKFGTADNQIAFVKISDRSIPSVEICNDLNIFGRKCVRFPLENYNGEEIIPVGDRRSMLMKSMKIPFGVDVTLFGGTNYANQIGSVINGPKIYSEAEFQSFKIVKTPVPEDEEFE